MGAEVEVQIREFIVKNFYVAAELSNDASLLEQGIVDSTGVLEVIGFLEKTFGIQVDDSEMVPENLDSVSAISAFVKKKKG